MLVLSLCQVVFCIFCRAVFLNSYHVRGPKKGGSTQQNGGLSLLGSRAAVVVMVAAALLGIFVM